MTYGTEVKHSDWLKVAIGLATTNQSALFQHSYLRYSNFLLMVHFSAFWIAAAWCAIASATTCVKMFPVKRLRWYIRGIVNEPLTLLLWSLTEASEVLPWVPRGYWLIGAKFHPMKRTLCRDFFRDINQAFDFRLINGVLRSLSKRLK